MPELSFTRESIRGSKLEKVIVRYKGAGGVNWKHSGTLFMPADVMDMLDEVMDKGAGVIKGGSYRDVGSGQPS